MNSSTRPPLPVALARMAIVAALGAALCRSAVAAPAELPPKLAQAVADAGSSGVPTAPLESKAREGLAKGITEERIATAMVALAVQMQAAIVVLADFITGPDRDDLVVAGARALQAGVSGATVRAAASVDPAARASAVRSVADLVALGFPEDRSLSLALVAARSGQATHNLDMLAGAAATLVAQGVPSADVLEQVGQALGADTANGEPPAWGAGGKNGKDPNGQGLDDAPGQQKK